MKFQSKIFIHYFTFSLIPNMIILLFLLILYQKDVENSLRKNAISENQSFSLAYDPATLTVKNTNFPYPVEDTLKRYLHSPSDDRTTFYSRGDKHYFRFSCNGRPEVLCDIIQVDSISWIHRLGLTNIFLSLTGINLIIVFLTAIFVSRMIVSPIDKIMAWINSASNQKINKNFNIQEIDLLVSKLEIAIEQERDLVEAKKMAAIGTIATQVAHDIRGPLSSMQTAVGFFSEMKIEDKKFGEVLNLLQLSAKRLTGVADGLLQSHKGVEEATIAFSLYKVLDELVGEYNSQCPEVKFNKEYASQSIELQGNSAKLQRAFGNIIKNAVEAMQFAGSITLRTELKNNQVIVAIMDAGPGMSFEKLQKVLNGGYTEGKKDGNGIGMTVVRETIKEHGGEIAATSALGKGTTFFITMPLLAKDQVQIVIQIEEGKPVIVIDDDPSLREQWRLILREQGKQTLLCESYEDFQSQKITPIISNTAVVDYHYDNSELNGGDVIRKLQTQGFTNLYLCTAEYWKPSVQKLAHELRVTLCPKPLPKIRISPLLYKEGLGEVESLPQPTTPYPPRRPCVGEEKHGGYNVLVIDDDPSIQMSWDVMQEKLGIATLFCYSNMETMQSNGVDLKNIDIAFVDKNIEGSAFTGADVISFLKTHCPGKIVLASGENEQTLRQDPQFAQADFIIQDKIPKTLIDFLNDKI